MSRHNPLAPGSNPVWSAFASQHPDSPHLGADLLVALPWDVLNALEDVPGLFSATDLRFERTLNAAVLRGFFHKRPMSAYPVGSAAEDVSEKTIEEVFLANTPGADMSGGGIGQAGVKVGMPSLLTEMWEAILADKGVAADAARELSRRKDEVDDKLRHRKEAYVGWLVIRPQYRQELKALRDRWAVGVRSWDRIPHPATTTGDAAVLACALDVRAFCRRWCLERLWAWDWPEPRLSVLFADQAATPLAPEEGVTLSVPWPMLRGGQIDFHDLIRDIGLEYAPNHLRDWVVGDHDVRARHGEGRHRTTFSLYRTLILALHRRYPDSRKGFVERVDAALARLLNVEPETVKVARLKVIRAMTDESISD